MSSLGSAIGSALLSSGASVRGGAKSCFGRRVAHPPAALELVTSWVLLVLRCFSWLRKGCFGESRHITPLEEQADITLTALLVSRIPREGSLVTNILYWLYLPDHIIIPTCSVRQDEKSCLIIINPKISYMHLSQYQSSRLPRT